MKQALSIIANWPITDPANKEAHDMAYIARLAVNAPPPETVRVTVANPQGVGAVYVGPDEPTPLKPPVMIDDKGHIKGMGTLSETLATAETPRGDRAFVVSAGSIRVDMLTATGGDKPQVANHGETLGESHDSWPAWCTTFKERTAYLAGIADARAVDKARGDVLAEAYQAAIKDRSDFREALNRCVAQGREAIKLLQMIAKESPPSETCRKEAKRVLDMPSWLLEK